jgi:hypothetical protein
MNLQDAAQQRRPEPAEFDWREYCEGHDYALADLLSEARNRSRRRLNWFNWFAVATLVLGVIAVALEVR